MYNEWFGGCFYWIEVFHTYIFQFEQNDLNVYRVKGGKNKMQPRFIHHSFTHHCVCIHTTNQTKAIFSLCTNHRYEIASITHEKGKINKSGENKQKGEKVRKGVQILKAK